jgi:hypothetical protein
MDGVKRFKLNHLVFNKIEGDAPTLKCANCAIEAKAEGWRSADIALNDGSGDSAMIVVCSKDCQRGFLAHPEAESFVRKVLAKVRAMREC